MTAENPISELLSAPLGPDWTIDWLAEQVLAAIAACGPKLAADVDELVLDSNTITDRQSRRLLRPLLACLANKGAVEAGTPANLYEGCFVFERPGEQGPVWIFGEFKNTPAAVHVRFHRSRSAPHNQQSVAGQSTVFVHDDARREDSPAAIRPDRPTLADL